MMMTDPLGDMLTRIRNAQRAKKSEVVSPASRLRESVLEVLKKEGFIDSFERYNVRSGIDNLKIKLKYFEGNSVIKEIYRVSTPGRRVYSSVNDLPRVYNGLGVSIISTPKGVMSDHDARKENVGGEILCQVF
ncbi:MAG: 30S ribosomal protein S8 [Alphaproteobacteria bacterium]